MAGSLGTTKTKAPDYKGPFFVVLVDFEKRRVDLSSMKFTTRRRQPRCGPEARLFSLHVEMVSTTVLLLVGR